MNPKIQILLNELEEDMIEFMIDDDVPYNKAHIDSCLKIISKCVVSIYNSTSKHEGLLSVKSAVEELNDLNEMWELIDTMEREMICEMIIIAGNDKGFNELDEDITFEWREW